MSDSFRQGRSSSGEATPHVASLEHIFTYPTPMPKTFRQKLQEYLETLEDADDRFTEARSQLDELASFARGPDDTQKVLEAHIAMREKLFAQRRHLDKL